MKDYSQLSEAARYVADASFISFMESLVFLFIIIIAMAFIVSLLRGSRSQQHRERMTDLYVIGMIRKFSKEDGIDLKEEMLELKKIWKLDRMGKDRLDKTIERELQEKISNRLEKKFPGKEEKTKGE